MADRWFVHKDGQSLGPFEASEIREALRRGSIDPFDLVSKEDSKVRRELVEIDEIFFTSKIVFGQEREATEHGRGASHRTAEFTQVSGSEQAISLEPSHAQPYGQGVLALADRKAAHENYGLPPPHDGGGSYETPIPKGGVNSGASAAAMLARRERRDPKRYFLSDDRGRNMGPVSASEIKSLFFKGVLSGSVLVLKEGSNARVPVAKFVAAYADGKKATLGSPLQQGAHPMMQGALRSAPSPANLKRQQVHGRFATASTGPGSSIVLVAVMLAALLIGGFAAWILISSGSVKWLTPDAAMVRGERPTAPRIERLPLPRPPKRSVMVPPSKPEVTQVAPRILPSSPARTETRRDLRAAKAAAAKAAAAKAALAKKQALAAARQAKVKRLEAEASQAKARARSLAALQKAKQKRAPVQQVLVQPKAPAPKPAMQPAVAPAPPKQTVSSLVSGQSVTAFGPFDFDRNAVKACEGACKIMFSGAGGRVRVNFFKSVWEDRLLSKSGSVRISGLVIGRDGNAPTLLLQDVK